MNFFAIPDHITKETHYINLDFVKNIKDEPEDKNSKLIPIYIKYFDNEIEFYEIKKSYFIDLIHKLI